MLVRHKDPLGYTTIANKRVYGKKYAYGAMEPTEIPFGYYVRHSDELVPVDYTGVYLSKRFNKKFPDVTFTHLRDLKSLHIDMLVEMANLLGIDFRKPLSWNEKDKLGVAQAIIRKLES